MTDLARQLANDEPKCFNCRYWERDHPPAHISACTRPYLPDHDLAKGRMGLFTTDLSVCSKWERITNAQTEAEAQTQ